jgi:hypothetical protein
MPRRRAGFVTGPGLPTKRYIETETYVVVDGWRVSCMVQTGGGRLLIREFHITPGSNSTFVQGGISARFLKRVTLSEHYEQAAGVLSVLPQYAIVPGSSHTWANWLTPMKKAKQLRGPQRVEMLAAVANDYVRAYQQHGGGVNRAVAERMGLTITQVRDRVYAARQAGLLEPEKVGRGQPGGRLTDKARDVLKGMEEEQ